MTLFVTPGQLNRRAEFFHQFAQLTAAGVTLGNLAGLIQRGVRGRESRLFGQRFTMLLEQGATATEAMRGAIPWLNDFEVAILEAGEKSGRLDVTFESLANHCAERARLARQIMADLAYPVFLYHFAVCVMALVAGLGGHSVATAIKTVVLGLLPFYGLLFLVLWSMQSQRGPVWRRFFEGVTNAIPFIGSARRSMAIARLSAALEALITAGVTIIESWELAARASGSPALERIVTAWRPQLLAGRTPAEMVNESAVFPEMFANLYATGEATGRLDHTLNRLREYYADDGTRKFRVVGRWLPILIYLLVAGMIGYFVIQFWTNYYGQMMNTF